MGSRLGLHALLESVLGSSNVYYQSPESMKLVYPCIVYEWSGNDTKFADDLPYGVIREYSVVVIDKNPDSEIPVRMGRLKMCTMKTSYRADNLNHFQFKLYY